MRKVVLRCDIEIVLILLGRHEETGGVRSVGASDFSNVHDGGGLGCGEVRDAYGVIWVQDVLSSGGCVPALGSLRKVYDCLEECSDVASGFSRLSKTVSIVVQGGRGASW